MSDSKRCQDCGKFFSELVNHPSGGLCALCVSERAKPAAAREWWILDNQYENLRRAFSSKPDNTQDHIHVVEKSALDKALARVAELEDWIKGEEENLGDCGYNHATKKYKCDALKEQLAAVNAELKRWQLGAAGAEFVIKLEEQLAAVTRDHKTLDELYGQLQKKFYATAEERDEWKLKFDTEMAEAQGYVEEQDHKIDQLRAEKTALQDYIEKNEPLDQATNAELRAEKDEMTERHAIVTDTCKLKQNTIQLLQDQREALTAKLEVAKIALVKYCNDDLWVGGPDLGHIAREALEKLK